MTIKNGDMPAMPQDADWKNDMERHLDSGGRSGSPSMDGIGLTKREQFAMAAMQGFIASNSANFNIATTQQRAEWAVEQADALLKALKEQE